MKLQAGLIIFMAFFTNFLSAQMTDGLVIKTQVLTNAIARNPNLAFEKTISDHYSIELEGIWMRNDRTSNSAEGANQKYYDSKGFALSLATRYYIHRRNAIPNGNYIAGYLRYNTTTIENVDKVYPTTGFYRRTIDLSRTGPELGFLAGTQFFVFNNITSEINAGIGHYWQSEKQTLVAGTGGPDFVNGVYRTSRRELRLYLHLTIGYLIGTKR